MSTYTLIKTADNHYILTSDEDINESIDSIWYGVGEDNSVIRRKAYTNITFTDEVAREIGYVDIEKKRDDFYNRCAIKNIFFGRGWENAYESAYLQAIEDNKERRYTEADIKEAFYEGFEKCKNDDGNCFTAWREVAPKLFSSLHKTSWKVEIEMEQTKLYIAPDDLMKFKSNPLNKETPYTTNPNEIFTPKITNNSIKVTKVIK